MKDELGQRILTNFVTLRPKKYSYSANDDDEIKKAQGKKVCNLTRT